MSLNNTPTKLWRVLAEGDIGIEIEVEGRRLPHLIYAPASPEPNHSKYWHTHDEGSLRGGKEYVIFTPIPISQVRNALEEWKFNLRNSVIEESLRTSVHMHFNVCSTPMGRIYSILCAYWLMENIFCHMNGKDREGNLFCLRLKDADNLQMDVLRDIRSGKHFSSIIYKNNRYSAVNLVSIRKFGSIEFRFMRGTHDINEISEWAHQLYLLVDKSRRISYNEVLQIYDQRGPIGFLDFFFSPEFIEKILKINNWQGMMEENVCYIISLIKALDIYNKEKPSFQVPVIKTSHEDIENEKENNNINSTNTSGTTFYGLRDIGINPIRGLQIEEAPILINEPGWINLPREDDDLEVEGN